MRAAAGRPDDRRARLEQLVAAVPRQTADLIGHRVAQAPVLRPVLTPLRPDPAHGCAPGAGRPDDGTGLEHLVAAIAHQAADLVAGRVTQASILRTVLTPLHPDAAPRGVRARAGLPDDRRPGLEQLVAAIPHQTTDLIAGRVTQAPVLRTVLTPLRPDAAPRGVRARAGCQRITPLVLLPATPSSARPQTTVPVAGPSRSATVAYFSAIGLPSPAAIGATAIAGSGSVAGAAATSAGASTAGGGAGSSGSARAGVLGRNSVAPSSAADIQAPKR